MSSDSRKSASDIKGFILAVMKECEDVRQRHVAMEARVFNDDAVYRSMVTEMLDMKTHAVLKMDYLLTCENSAVWHNYVLAMTLLFAFRERMRGGKGLMKELEKSPSSGKALELCKNYGLLSESVTEVNDLGETPLIRACADGVSDDKLALLLKAGSDVNSKVSYAVAEDMTPLLVASLYGRTSTISLLAKNGANVHAGASGAQSGGCTGVYFAAQNDFLIL